jgi:hypothetical protein
MGVCYTLVCALDAAKSETHARVPRQVILLCAALYLGGGAGYNKLRADSYRHPHAKYLWELWGLCKVIPYHETFSTTIQLPYSSTKG